MLWDGPLGKTIGGTHPELFEDVTVSAHWSKTHFARSMRLAAVRYEEVIEYCLPNKPLARFHESSISAETFWSGGSGIPSVQHVSRSAGVAAAEIANQVEKKCLLLRRGSLKW